MSEIEKMYKNAEVKKQIPKECSNNELYCKECKAHIEDAMPYCKNAEYPPFTAEKQLELIKWLVNYGQFFCHKFEDEWVIDDEYNLDNACISKSTFQECLTAYVNNLWQDLTEIEQEEIRKILKG